MFTLTNTQKVLQGKALNMNQKVNRSLNCSYKMNDPLLK